MRRLLDIGLVAAVVGLVVGSILLAPSDEADPPAPEPDPAAALFGYDASQPLDVQREGSLKATPVRLRRVSFATFDSDRVPAVVAIPRGGPTGACAITQPGIGGTLNTYEVPEILVNRGYLTLTIEPRFTGTRMQGKTDAFAAAKDPRLLAGLMRESVIDLRRGIDYLEQEEGCRSVGYFGASLGGMLGALLAGADDRIAEAALVVAGGDWRKLVASNRVFLPEVRSHPREYRRALRRLRPLDPARWVGEISPRPLVLANGRQDTLIDPPAARALRAAARPPVRAIWFQGGHFEALNDPRVVAAIESLFPKARQPSPPSGGG